MTKQKGVTLRCPVCRKLFFGRSNAVYSSDKCRQKAHRSKTSCKDEKQAIFRQAIRCVNDLVGLDAQNQLRIIAMQTIDSLNDESRNKLYDALRDDMYRIRDRICHG